MSKKRRWRPVVRVDVEDPRAALGVAPTSGLLVVGGHVVGDDVEHDPEPGRALRASASHPSSPPSSSETRVGSTTS